MNQTRGRALARLGLLVLAAGVAGCGALRPAGEAVPEAEIVLRGGTVYDGSGTPGQLADVGIAGGRIAAVAAPGSLRGRTVLDVRGLAVAPGFINMLSWADESLLVDPRSLSDLLQGVTLEVFGEGTSMGPLTPAMRQRLLERQGDLQYDVPWTTLGEYLEHLETRGVATNVASFVGAATVREYVLGLEDRAAGEAELAAMQELVRVAMREGAMGVGSSLPYIPGAFASTEELTALAAAAAPFGGGYISHIRDEGDALLPAIEEFLDIVRTAGVWGEVYHLKASGRENWGRFEEALDLLEAARAEGLRVGADIYPYAASSTGLSYVLPAWVQEGGHAALVARLQDSAVRERLPAQMEMIPPEDILLVGFRNPELRHLTGSTLAEVARARRVSPEIAVMDLIVEDDSRIDTVRFTMSEDNVRRALQMPWISICSDAGSIAPEPPFTHRQPHPRAYGTFARVLGRYVREQGVLPLEEAIHRMSGLPAARLGLTDRGLLRPGFAADIVVFDPRTVADRATYQEPHQLAVGVHHVFVNGVRAVADGASTGALAGRFVRGPGAVPDPATQDPGSAVPVAAREGAP